VVGSQRLSLPVHDHGSDVPHSIMTLSFSTLKVIHRHKATTNTGGHKCSFRSRDLPDSAPEKSRGEPRCDDAQHPPSGRSGTCGHVKRRGFSRGFDVWIWHLDLTTSPASKAPPDAAARGPENVGRLVGCNDDDAFIGLKKPSIRQQLVQRCSRSSLPPP